MLNHKTLLFQRNPTKTWTNRFARHIPPIWIANIESQFILNSHETVNDTTIVT